MTFRNLDDALAESTTLFGMALVTPSRYALEAYAHAPCDFVLIDTQHSLMDESQAGEILLAIKGIPFPALIRVSSNDDTKIGKVLDAGAVGVIVPMVETAEQAKCAVAASLYAPAGVRSYGPIRSDIAKLSIKEVEARARVFVMIETVKGLANAAEIGAVPGLAGIFIGPGDLSVALGLEPMAAFSTDQLREAIAMIRAACDSNRILLGAFAVNVESAQRWERWGVRLISIGSDVSLLNSAAAELMASARGELAETPEIRSLY